MYLKLHPYHPILCCGVELSILMFSLSRLLGFTPSVCVVAGSKYPLNLIWNKLPS